jgi:hypothetical protein
MYVSTGVHESARSAASSSPNSARQRCKLPLGGTRTATRVPLPGSSKAALSVTLKSLLSIPFCRSPLSAPIPIVPVLYRSNPGGDGWVLQLASTLGYRRVARSKIYGLDTETVSGLGLDVGPVMTHASARNRIHHAAALRCGRARHPLALEERHPGLSALPAHRRDTIGVRRRLGVLIRVLAPLVRVPRRAAFRPRRRADVSESAVTTVH